MKNFPLMELHMELARKFKVVTLEPVYDDKDLDLITGYIINLFRLGAEKVIIFVYDEEFINKYVNSIFAQKNDTEHIRSSVESFDDGTKLTFYTQ